jgi:hypothetical protein
MKDAEADRLAEDDRREKNWKRWGPYLAERQWGTVREDYSAKGTPWEYFPHDHARSRAYRWGEDGLLGITDRECRLCFALALWNGKDPYLKERLFGLSGHEGNHGEDVKECYYYLDATPTNSYLKALYRYPQEAFPYASLIEENGKRGREDPEFELEDTGVFDNGRYFDVTAEYAKAGPDDIYIRITIANRGPQAAEIHVLPTLWFRNTWSWGRSGPEYPAKPLIQRETATSVLAEHATLGRFKLEIAPAPGGMLPKLLFTENESNDRKLFGANNASRFTKDGFHDRVVSGTIEATNPESKGTRAAFWQRMLVPARGEARLRLRLSLAPEGRTSDPPEPLEFGAGFDLTFEMRRREADAFYAAKLPANFSDDERAVARQAWAGLLWSRQFYHYVVSEWLDGDPGQIAPPIERLNGRNAEWRHLHNRDLILMPDKWEYPWYAAWDLGFHAVALSKVDPAFARSQLVLFLREWYMHPNGKLPSYEWEFSDANPPVHAWAVWRTYKLTGPRGKRDRAFLERTFHKLLINFTWWVNRKDIEGHNLFAGGFLGLDNIGVFDRSHATPGGSHLEQADGTAWMAFYCATMLSIALELASEDAVYEDVASKFFEHYVAIVDAMNSVGGTGLWDEADGFYYDQLHVDGSRVPLKLRSMVGLVPLIACEIIDDEVINRLPAFKKRMEWFIHNRPELSEHISYMRSTERDGHCHRLLAIPSSARLERVLKVMLDENEFLSPYGVRSLSRTYRDQPYRFDIAGENFEVRYAPAESDTALFGGNSNWRGPVWMPLNYLLVEALERYHHFYGDSLEVEFPTGSGRKMNLLEISYALSERLAMLFLPGADGIRPCHGAGGRYANDPLWKDMLLFHEYFDGDTGRGLGASHQTGWTALVVRCLEKRAAARLAREPRR